ncbi:MAG: galactonate dehydratase [Cytophagales bacterium]|uniref:galactonate dehydratase n=1 Tax=Cyclobacterium marinum TaxID=104 RepID=UPI0011ED0531|nr:galactonate dehydratase [Cyclobacterium marinum]MBI0401842.1 galactonate dehydratase [Cyclobacterium marinum]MBR9775736.1 galactonate dehydratase [Cytophagales bacterium]|tara:strand:+ start:5433 stop:6701 length:1269 start_codon:yes stop_codon:yes gene_type:complete
MKKTKKKVTQQPVGGKVSRRNAIQSVLGLAGTGLLLPLSSYAEKPSPTHFKEGEVRITKLETFLVKPRWIFLKIHTDAGVVGLGEPLLEGRALTIQTAIKELEPYLIGKDPRRVVHHWQAIYRHAFYRGGPILTSALSGIDHALWDIKGKLLGVPVYELFGGPTRDRVRIYGRASNAEDMKKRKQEGYTVIKTGVAKKQPARIVENPAFIQYAADNFASLREAGGPEMDIGIDFHGAISPQTAKVLIKELEQYQPMFVEEPCQAQNVDVMAEIARGTHLPIATGERIFTKWGFREILEKGAAAIVQPDLCHAGGLTEGRLIAGMAEAYYAAIAPHNPMGPISLACGLHLAASVPNFLVQEQVTLGEGYLKNPFKLESDGTVLIPKGPGLGIELDEDALEDKIGHDWTNPQSYDPRDGSVVDW